MFTTALALFFLVKLFLKTNFYAPMFKFGFTPPKQPPILNSCLRAWRCVMCVTSQHVCDDVAVQALLRSHT